MVESRRRDQKGHLAALDQALISKLPNTRKTTTTNRSIIPSNAKRFIFVVVVAILCYSTPTQQLEQQIGQTRNSSWPASTTTNHGNQNHNKKLSSTTTSIATTSEHRLKGNTSTPIGSRSLDHSIDNKSSSSNNNNNNNNSKKNKLPETTGRELTARIATLDDLSHRLDQTRDNVPLELDDTRVPFWNIAHMINSIEQVDLALGAGSNGIETDVSFDSHGHPTYAYHGVPCDCGRHCFHQEDLVKFVQHLAHITIPPASSRLLVVLFDLKLKDLKEPRQKETAGLHLAELLHKHLYAPYLKAASYYSIDQRGQPPLRVVVSINHASDILVAKSFISYMRNNHLDFMGNQVGFDVGMNDNLTEISQAWDELNGATFNIWQGDGLTNCVNIVRSFDRLKQAISIRNEQGHFRKVYFWTADIMYHIRTVLRLGLDAMLTNKPQRVNQVLNEPEFKSKYRLATPYDNPFEQFRIRPSSWGVAPPTVGEIVETIHNIKETSSNFIKTLPDGISAVFNRVTHRSTTG
uniref:Sphingomyelin phosphodiesterase D LspiSicTox-betaIE1ii n=1 Tax=Aceria tosichella TaxID=561515 RepID=A0A6G1SHX8_9ACAR